MSDVYNQLGSWTMCQEQLTRIADAIEAIQANTQVMADNTETMVTWQEMLDDLEATLGIGNIFFLLAKTFSDMFPSFKNIKISPMPLIQSIWRTKTFEGPLLLATQAQAASQSGILATLGASKALDQIKTIVEGFGTLNDYYDNIRDAIFGDWNVLDWFSGLLDWFIPDGEGGTGGEDPDNDPELRTAVNVAVNVQTPITVNCDNCGSSGHNSSCCPIPGGDTPIEEFPENDPTEEPPREGDPPTGYPDWPSYDADKCARIKKFLDDYIGTLNNWGGLAGMAGGLTVAVIVGLCLLTVPPVGLTILLAALGALFAIDSALFLHFATIASYLTDNIDDIVCDMLDDTSTDAMKTTLSGYIDDAIDSLGVLGAGVGANLDDAAKNLISNDNLDFIISGSGVPEGYEGYDCPCDGGGCEGQLFTQYPQTSNWGNVDSWDGTTLTGTSEFGDGAHRFNWNFVLDETDPCCRQIITISTTGATHGTAQDYYVPCGETGPVEAPSGNIANLDGECVHALVCASDTSFSIYVTFQPGDCDPE